MPLQTVACGISFHKLQMSDVVRLLFQRLILIQADGTRIEYDYNPGQLELKCQSFIMYLQDDVAYKIDQNVTQPVYEETDRSLRFDYADADDVIFYDVFYDLPEASFHYRNHPNIVFSGVDSCGYMIRLATISENDYTGVEFDVDDMLALGHWYKELRASGRISAKDRLNLYRNM